MKIYLVCSVRNCDEDEKKRQEKYVEELEAQGHEVHYPPRDVDQTDDGVGLNIVLSHRKAMMMADEVHFMWNPDSKGSYFDFGMAYMLSAFQQVKIVLVDGPPQDDHKSYTNVLYSISEK